MRRTAVFATIFGIALAPMALSAANSSASLTVSASVTNNCTITTSPLLFPAYDPVVANASANADGSGKVTVACTKGVAPSIGLGAGSNAQGNTRRLSDGTNFLTYDMYSDAGRSTAWASSGSGLVTATAAASKAARDFTVYGRIAGNQDVPAGSYADTIVATVNF